LNSFPFCDNLLVSFLDIISQAAQYPRCKLWLRQTLYNTVWNTNCFRTGHCSKYKYKLLTNDLFMAPWLKYYLSLFWCLWVLHEVPKVGSHSSKEVGPKIFIFQSLGLFPLGFLLPFLLFDTNLNLWVVFQCTTRF